MSTYTELPPPLITSRPVSVLFVCLGNICRSPMAEYVFRHMACNGLKVHTIIQPAPSSTSSLSSSLAGAPHDPTSAKETVAMKSTQGWDRLSFGRIDSCGTTGYNAGSKPDPRTLRTLERCYGTLSGLHRARKIQESDFHDFDYILAMDRANLADIHAFRRKCQRRQHAARSQPDADIKSDSSDPAVAAPRPRRARIALFGAFTREAVFDREGADLPRRTDADDNDAADDDDDDFDAQEALAERTSGEEIEDPYYGDDEGFERTKAQCARFASCFLGFLDEEARKEAKAMRR